MKKTLLALFVAALACGAVQLADAQTTLFKIYIKGIRGAADAATSASSPDGASSASAPGTPSSFLATACGKRGSTGPTSAMCASSYGTQYAAESFSVTSGVQHWTVPATASYQINITGATGGDGTYSGAGYGASLRVNVTLTQGQVLDVIVGQQGTSGSPSGGGGGASSVSIGGVPLIVAGGGGGGGKSGAGWNATATTKSGGTGTSGGSLAESGAGFFGNGPVQTNYGQAIALSNGGLGSTGGNGAVAGGFGGGGGGGLQNGGGGAGGYDGGPSGNGGGGGSGDSYWSSSTTYVSGGVTSVTQEGNVSITPN